MTEDARWLIWSYEHDAWWRPGGFGYTRALAEAGVYSGADVDRIIRQANVVTVNEVAVLKGAADRFTPYPSIACPFCRRRSFNLDDIAQRYCGACHRFHDVPEP